MDPQVARFIARHHRSVREAVEDDVAPHRGQSPAESWADLVAVCRAAAAALAANPERDRIVAAVDPPHPSLRGILARLRARAREGP
ncbi:MAG: hypothetical protein AB7N76_21715 [Planctomycetota bacterium]